MLALLAAPTLAWEISAGYAYNTGGYANYGYNVPYYGYYNNYNPYYYGGYAPTVYTTYGPDMVYTTQRTTVNYDSYTVPVAHQDNTVKVYVSNAGDYNYESDSQYSTRDYCGDGWCSSSESQHSCPSDCTPAAYCGDGVCSAGETSSSCNYDCKVTTTTSATRTVSAYCGDGACNGAETEYSCATDCGLPDYCGDGSCNGAETKYNCAVDCGIAPYCGDGTCNLDESKYNCALDCGLPAYCGDDECNGDETSYSCSLDCGNARCTNPTGSEGSTTCRGNQILFCDAGFWEFKRTVQCCGSGDCPSGYTCSYNSCVLVREPEPCNTCPAPLPPAPVPVPVDYCGDGTCNAGETCATCYADCGQCYYCGDGVCNSQTENQQNCAIDCGDPITHEVELVIPDECQEIQRGEDGKFTLIVYNYGSMAETLSVTALGQWASWADTDGTVTVAAGGSEAVDVDVDVPDDIDPGLYDLAIKVSNTKVSDTIVLKVDVKLEPLTNATELANETQGTTEGGTDEGDDIDESVTIPTGAIISGDLVIPDWTVLLAVILVLVILFILLLGSKSEQKVTTYALATDGGKNE